MVTTLFGESLNYRQLSRSRATLLGSLSLWEAADHFVQIEVLGFSETHKRFYFEDVRAFTIRPTWRGLWLHLLFGFFSVLTAAMAVWTFSSGYFSGGLDWLAILVPSAFALVWGVHLALGPTCACHVMTPVQNAHLGALSRTRQARKVLNYLARRAQTSQGGVATSVVAGTEAAVVPGAPKVGQPGPAGPSQATAFEAGPSRLYLVLSSTCLLNAGLLFSLLLWDSYALRAVQVLFIVGLLGLGITCAAGSRASSGQTASWFKPIGWTLFAVNGVVFVLWYGYGMYLASVPRSRAAPGVDLTYVQEMLQISPHGSRFWLWVVLVDACCSMLLGLIGLSIIFLGTRKSKRPDEL
jgi:hypothetical protein